MQNRQIDLRNLKTEDPITIGDFGGENGLESYSVTNRYITRNGKPCFPIMGEFHYSRYPAQYWEESILKMKAGGINVLSSYVFWIHHEEERGEYDWTGNKNLHRFISLCKKHDLRVILRIGPWAHGECRNGGFPDWLMKLGIDLRENDNRYFDLAQTFYSEIYNQVKEFLFYKEGPIIGVQIENEYGHCGGLHGEEGKEHILTLKKLAVEVGFRVPFYTSTGWGNGIVVEGETLPVLGGYAEAPWEQHIGERRAESNYLFRAVHLDTTIGTDLAAYEEACYSYDVTKYPYLTAELGGGQEPTYHRRPIISADDTGALAMTFLGSGTNLLGYYMYHGGTNPIGKFSTLQESKATGYQNDVPELSYDFQAPMNEYGERNDSYGRLKALHLFLQDFGEEMAESLCFIPEDNPKDAEDMKSLRYSVRYGEKGGFLFLNNYQRRRKMTEKSDINIDVITKTGNFQFRNITLPDGKYCFFPFNMRFGELKLLSATAQLLCKIENQKDSAYVFFCDEDEISSYRFPAEQVQQVTSHSFKMHSEYCEIQIGKSEFYEAIPVTLKSGEVVKIITITRQDAYRAWKVKNPSGDYLLISKEQLYGEAGALAFVSHSRSAELRAFPQLPRTVEVEGAKYEESGTAGDFQRCLITFNGADCLAGILKMKEYKNNGKVSCEFFVNRSEGNSIEDDVLHIRFEGDRARLYIDNQFCADWFYNGLDWQVGLKRFGNLDGKRLRIDVEPLQEDDHVFLEKNPEYHDGVACSIHEISLEPVYQCEIRLAF